MNYTGKICDGCREPLKEGDDIVVCPICGTPQHRSCYEKNNKCVNEYLHSTGFTWTDPDEEKRKAEAEQAVQQEQEQPEQSSPFVQATPQSMESVFMRGVLYDPKDDIGGATVGEAADYIQNSAPRYISKFMKQKKKIQVEIDSKQNHKYRDHTINICTVIIADTCSPVRESSCSGSTECM